MKKMTGNVRLLALILLPLLAACGCRSRGEARAEEDFRYYQRMRNLQRQDAVREAILDWLIGAKQDSGSNSAAAQLASAERLGAESSRLFDGSRF